MGMLRKLVLPVMAVAVLAVFCGCGEKTTAEKAGDAVENGVKAVQDGAGDVAPTMKFDGTFSCRHGYMICIQQYFLE